MNNTVSQEELIYRIALSLTPKIGPKTAIELLQYFGTAKNVFENSSTQELCQFQQINISTAQKIMTQNTLQRAEQEWRFIERYHITVLSQEDERYPKRLKNCPDPPFLLYYKGNTNLNASKVIAIVGTRKPTAQGKIICERLVQELLPYQPLVVSGLAYGIDITTHKQALSLGLPNIGIVGHGLDRIYPHKHLKTAHKMVQCGGILTEFVTETAPLPPHFPMRNRIIAGMADAILVIETADRGGSMITAHIANEYNKDVFAVPGRLTDPLSKGCNHLIKTHRAALLESVADIAYILRWERQKAGTQKQLFQQLNTQEKRIVSLLVGEDAVHLDKIINHTHISTSKMAALLLELEFKGVIRALPGKSFRLL